MAKQVLDIGFFSIMYSQTNGTAHAVRFLSEALAKTGHNVHIFAPKIENGYKIPSTLHFHELGGARLSSNTEFVLSFPIHKYFFCPHDYLDIGHIHTHTTIGAMAINWCKFLGIPMVGTHNSPLQFYAAQYFPVIGRLLTRFDLTWRYERHILDKYDFVHVPTKTKKELLMEYRFKEPIVCFSNGIHDMYFKNLKENGIREKYGLVGKKVLLYASRMSPEKHMVSVIKKFKQIHKEVPNAHLMIVGSNGPSTVPVKKLAKKFDFVTCAGRVPFDDLLKLYNTADLTCLWSWIEAEGLVLIEAMAQGTPSVGANGCGIKDVIRHGKTGYLANNFDEFRDYVVKLFKDDELRIQFGKNAKKVAQMYKVSNIAKIWIEMYKFAINQLYPLRYYKKERKHRVELVKEFVHKLPTVNF
ncbi:MAG: glycosyltransferase [Candidatus Lokiarchaeota archaeon]|nr:glycosyltransferase [Candidatus Lokiarchaeota archaeon]MBD3340344.1 glycosyltransferase [Candidatus Lokiarchaeota archaeon]